MAVIDQDGEVLANRNVPNGTETILGVIGGLPAATPTAFEAAFGWGWLVELLEDYGFDPRLVRALDQPAPSLLPPVPDSDLATAGKRAASCALVLCPAPRLALQGKTGAVITLPRWSRPGLGSGGRGDR